MKKMSLKVLLSLVVCICALCVAVGGQQKNAPQKDEGEIIDCTEPEVLTAEGVNLKAPVELVWSDMTRCLCTLVTAAFKGADRKSLVFELNGTVPEGKDARPHEFKVINKCRQTENSLEYLQTTNIRAGSKEEIAILKFLRSWLEANVPEEQRVRYQRAIKLTREERNKEFGGFSEEEAKFWYLYVALNAVEKRKEIDPTLKTQANP